MKKLKALVSADIHIHPYSNNYGKGKDFRINQFKSLGLRIIELIKSEDYDEFWVLGDFVHVPKEDPKTFHIIKDIFKSIHDETGVKIKYTLGNHDVDSKSENISKVDSIITTYLTEEIGCYYMGNSRTCNYEGTGVDIQWKDFVPNKYFDKFIEDMRKVDLLCGHQNTETFFGGLTWDTSKYKVGLFGDIHYRDIQKTDGSETINVCNPLGHRVGETDSYFSEIILNKGKVSHSYIPASTEEYPFLRLCRKGKEPKDWGKSLDVIVESNKTSTSDDSNLIDVTDIDISNLIQKEVSKSSEESLKEFEIIRESNRYLSVEPKNYDLGSLHIDYIDIENFRSIDSLSMEFEKGSTRFKGNAGSGKTSVLRAIITALVGCGSQAKRLRRRGQKSPWSIELALRYKESEYLINRGQSSLAFFKDGEEIVSGTRKGVQESIDSELEFLDIINIIYLSQFSTGVLDSMRQAEKVSYISKIFGWDSITVLHEMSKESLKEVKAEVVSVGTALIEARSSKSVIEEDLKSMKIDRTLKEVDEDHKILTDILDCKDKIDGYDGLIEQSTSKITMLESYIQSDEDTLSAGVTDLEKKMAKKQDSLKEVKCKISKVQSRISDLESSLSIMLKTINGEKEKITKVGRECSKCGASISQDQIDKQIKEIQESIDINNADYKSKYKKQEKLVSKYRKEEEKSKKIESSMDSIKSKIDKVNNDKRYISDIERLKVDLVKANKDLDKSQKSLQKKLDSRNVTLEDIPEMLELAVRDRSILNVLELKKESLSEYEALIIKLEGKEKAANSREEGLSGLVHMSSPSGSIMKSSLEKAAESLSTDNLKVTTLKTQANGKEVPDLTVSLKVGTDFIPYEDLSGGQRLYADTIFTTNLLTSLGSGLLIIDEYMRFASPEIIDKTIEQIEDSKFNQVIIVEHNELTPMDTEIFCSMDEDGVSVYK